jgi:hypothetical protein
MNPWALAWDVFGWIVLVFVVVMVVLIMLGVIERAFSSMIGKYRAAKRERTETVEDYDSFMARAVGMSSSLYGSDLLLDRKQHAAFRNGARWAWSDLHQGQQEDTP